MPGLVILMLALGNNRAGRRPIGVNQTPAQERDAMWQDLDKQAMAALMDGNEDKAIDLWSKCIVLMETEPNPTVEMATAYHFVGKCLARTDLETAVKYLMTAEKIIVECEPAHSSLKQVKYDLGEALSKAGRSDESDARLRYAKDLVSAPLPDCLSGPRSEDLDLKRTVKLFQKCGILKQLSAKEFKSIKQACIKDGRADAGADDDSIHPFDLLWQYYQSESLAVTDHAILLPELDFIDQIEEVLDAFNQHLGSVLFSSKDVAEVTDEEQRQPFIIVNREADGPVAARVNDVWDVVKIYNTTLKHSNVTQRVVRIAGYDGREIALVMSLETAAKIFRGGGAHIFENLAEDLDPVDPPLSKLN